jgi:hypothetical protein
MENTEKIVFLYDEKSIPDQIIEAAKAQTPSGFELVLCESQMVEKERRVQVAQADYFPPSETHKALTRNLMVFAL